MANRLYIYSSAKPNHHSLFCAFIEANYDLPLYFYPLLAGNAKLIKHDIFTDSAIGLAFFEQFCNFVDCHAKTLITNNKAWQKNRQLMFAEVANQAKHGWFKLEMGDVYQMSSEPASTQAEQMLAQIQHYNSTIQDAIDANNPAILDSLAATHTAGIANFKALQFEDAWPYFEAYYESKNGTDFPIDYEENGKFGFKNKAGNIITPAIYNKTYEFSEYTKLSIAQKDDKFVFINYKGKLEFDTEFDDLFDFFDNYEAKNQTAIAKQGEKYGLINRKGKWVVQPEWDDLSGLYNRGQLIAAKKGDMWGVIDEAGKIIVAPSLPFAPKPNDERNTSYFTCAPEDDEPVLYLSLKWKPFTLKNNEKIESIHACDDIKTLLGEGKETRYGLMNSNAETLLETIYNVVEFDNATQIYTIKQDKKWGLYDGEKGWLLPCEFDSLTSVYALFSGSLYRESDSNWVVRKGKQYGFYDSKNLTWVLDCTQGKITPFAKNVIGVVRNLPIEQSGIWVHNACTGASLAGPFESLSDSAGGLEFSAVLGFTQNEVMTIGQTGLVKPLTKTQADSLLMHMPSEDTHGEYYFTLAQGDLIKQYFSKKIKGDFVFEDAEALIKKGKYNEALALYLQAAKEGNVGAYVNAGYLLASQPEIEDLTRARQYYQIAADANEPQGMNNLGCCYRDGDGGPQDIAKAFALFKQAEAQNNMMARMNLAQIYYDDGPLQDHAQALKYFLSCYREHPRPLEIGYLYDNFLRDYTSALKYYQLSANNGDGYSYNRIGLMWEEGLLGKVDLKKAQESYEKAIKAEYSEAYAGLNLAKLLISTDPVAAKKAFQFAVGHEDVVEGLTEFGQAQGWL